MPNNNLRDLEKMGVCREKNQPILHNSRGNPHIVGGDGGAGFPERIQNNRIPFGRFFIHGRKMNAG